MISTGNQDSYNPFTLKIEFGTSLNQTQTFPKKCNLVIIFLLFKLLHITDQLRWGRKLKD
jgi:hypothetical protein